MTPASLFYDSTNKRPLKEKRDWQIPEFLKNSILKDKLVEKEIITPLELGALKSPVGNGKSVKEMIVNLVDTYFSQLKTVDHDAAPPPETNETNQKLLRGGLAAPTY